MTVRLVIAEAPRRCNMSSRPRKATSLKRTSSSPQESSLSAKRQRNAGERSKTSSPDAIITMEEPATRPMPDHDVIIVDPLLPRTQSDQQLPSSQDASTSRARGEAHCERLTGLIPFILLLQLID